MTAPDLILIVLDTQRADRLGAYGNKRGITPNLDRFAARGVVFEQAISPAQWTIPSHASLFTGLYPTAHQVTQSAHSLSPDVPHLAEILQAAGYETVGFCNNPLVGILDNGFKRGFDTFYNYGGAIPSVPKHSGGWPWPLNWAAERYTQFLRRLSYPIQNFFGQSDLAFRVSLNAWLTPLWSRLANFKGQNERSVMDVMAFLRQREKRERKRPLFLFLNLMETHLPFWPPGEFIDQVAPYFRGSQEARTILRTWNREAYRWAAPLAEPLAELESRVLNDLYDAEVAYQDRYLGHLFEVLDRRQNAADTMTAIVSDHGDGLGEHGYFGHAFVAYQELVHVPLMLQWPAQLRPGRQPDPVSTRRVFHTLLSALDTLPAVPGLDAQAAELSLFKTLDGADPEQLTALSEVYPPLNFVKAIRQRQPALLSQFRCLSMRRAVVKKDGGGSMHKLIDVDDVPDELFDLHPDPLELDDLLAAQPERTAVLAQAMAHTVGGLVQQRKSLQAGQTINVEADPQLLQRLRGLGYLD